jgi:hypothetical protein
MRKSNSVMRSYALVHLKYYFGSSPMKLESGYRLEYFSYIFLLFRM